MKKNKAYKFRIYPNKEQKILFEKTFGCVRFIYNRMLADKIDHYKETKQTLRNTPAQYKKEFEWLKEVDSLALANAQLNLQKAYSNFFRDPKVGFPKFKSKKQNRFSYTTNNQHGTINIENKQIRLPKVGKVKIVLHRQVRNNEEIKSCTISRTPTNKYYVSVLVEYDWEPIERYLDLQKSLGLDYSSSNFYVDSQGVKINYPKFYRASEVKLVKEQRKLSNMKYTSNNYKKQKLKVAKVHETISNQRKDFIHKLSHSLAENWDIICVEDLDMKNISQTLNLGKSTMDNGFGMFRNVLDYKLADRGKLLVKIDKWFPSSKTCHVCGEVNKNLQLSDREWICKSCNTFHDRDINAAINIRTAGTAEIARECSVH